MESKHQNQPWQLDLIWPHFFGGQQWVFNDLYMALKQLLPHQEISGTPSTVPKCSTSGWRSQAPIYQPDSGIHSLQVSAGRCSTWSPKNGWSKKGSDDQLLINWGVSGKMCFFMVLPTSPSKKDDMFTIFIEKKRWFPRIPQWLFPLDPHQPHLA